MKRCSPDIRKFCSHITVEDSEELEGEIIQCLKKKFAVKVILIILLLDLQRNYYFDIGSQYLTITQNVVMAELFF